MLQKIVKNSNVFIPVSMVIIGCAPRGFLEGISRQLLRSFYEGFLERVFQWALEKGRVLRRVLRRRSKKGLSRRHLEGRKTHFLEYDPNRLRPRSKNELRGLKVSVS